MVLEIVSESGFSAFVLTLVAAYIVATLVHFVLKKYVKAFFEKTPSELDDALLGITAEPLYAFLLLVGFYWALGALAVYGLIAAWLDPLFVVLVILIAAFWFSRLLTLLVNKWLKTHERFHKAPRLASKALSITVYLIAGLMILAFFNVEITPLVAALGIGGLAVGLALQNTLSNFFAGLYLISDKPIAVGDFVELEGSAAGYVDDINWRSTRIRTRFDQTIIVPNARLAESIIVNDSLPRNELTFSVACGVAYESSLKKVEQAVLEVAKHIQQTVEGCVKDYSPSIRFFEFGDSNINFKTYLRVEEPLVKYLATHEFVKELKVRFDREKIEISWPIRKIYKEK